MLYKIFILFVIFGLWCNTSIAQRPNSSTITQENTFTSIAIDSTGNDPPVELSSKSNNSRLTDREFILSICVLGFGLIIILIIFFFGRSEPNSEDAFKLTTVALIITSSLFLVIAGYSSTQIAPVIGLLGTIAGYLLGKTSSSNEKKS